jgi:type VI secretion system secreted protein Hcp
MKSWMRSSLFSLCLAGLVLVPVSAEAALRVYLKMKGDKQGDIKGDVFTKGYEWSIDVKSFNHELTAAYDPSTGALTGKRQHNPLVITKKVDRSSPLLAAMLATGENIPTWEITVFSIGAQNAVSILYKIKLHNAKIISLQQEANVDGEFEEVVSFTYKKIEWLWTANGGITTADSW